MEVSGKNVLVVGLARTGLAAARCLSRRGAVVTITDLRPPSAFSKEMPELLQQKIGLELGLHREATFLRQDMIVVSPGVPFDIPALKRAREQGIPIVPEIELAAGLLEARLVGITGTNGKTTTTALTGKILEASGFPTFVGGNIGVPLLAALDQTPPPSVLVCELSSFQLEAIRSFHPQVAVLLNLTPNHLDRHPSFEAYVAAKANIFRNQTEEDYAVLNADDATVMKLVPAIKSRKIFFSRRQELLSGVFMSDGKIRYRVRNLEAALMEAHDVRLRGEFNLENVLAATAAACVLGAEFAAVRRAIREFRGVEHRLEFVREIQGVAFYNDSKATSVDAASKALSTFSGGVHLILGGKDKGAPYEPLRSLIKDRVKEVLLIGAAAERIAAELAGAGEMVMARDLQTAVKRAFEQAESGDAVLLAPACSSFDQFEDFEQRGRVFKELVQQLAEWSLREGAARRHDAGRRSARSVASPSAQASFSRLVIEPQKSFSELKQGPAAETTEPPATPAAPRRNAVPSPAQKESPQPMISRELVYTFEVSAGEAFPGDTVIEADDTGDILIDSADLAPAEDVQDEVLPYEVRSSSGSSLKGK